MQGQLASDPKQLGDKKLVLVIKVNFRALENSDCPPEMSSTYRSSPGSTHYAGRDLRASRPRAPWSDGSDQDVHAVDARVGVRLAFDKFE